MTDRSDEHSRSAILNGEPDAADEPPGERPRARIEVVDGEGLLGPARRAWLEARALEAVNAAAEAGGEVRAAVVGDAAMADLHLRHSGIAGTTDVLTFDLREPAPGEDPASRPLDVDVVVCIDEAARRAAERGHAVERELLLYVLHGVLHCLGYDDHDDAAYERMHAREDEILESIGVGTTFRDGGAGPGGAS